ncbi:hypothetical protein JCM10296v2_001230 [Rhodotorula toruloides]
MITQSDPSPTLPARATRQRKPATDANYVYDVPAGAIASSSWSSAPPSASSTSFPSAPTAPTNVAAQPLASPSKRRRSNSAGSPNSQPRKRSKGKSGKTGGGDVKAGKKGKERSGRVSKTKGIEREIEEETAEEAFLEAIAEEAEEEDGAPESSDTEYTPDLDADDGLGTGSSVTDGERAAPKKRRRTRRGVKANGRGGKKGKGKGGEKSNVEPAPDDVPTVEQHRPLTAQETRRVFTAGAPSSSPLRPTEAQRTSFFDKIGQVQAEWKTDDAQVAKELATWDADWARTKAIAAQNGVQLDDRRRIERVATECETALTDPRSSYRSYASPPSPSGSDVQPALVLMHYAPSPTVLPEGRRHSQAPHENKTTRKHQEAGLGSGGIAFLDLDQQSFRIPSYDKLGETKVGHPPPEKDAPPRVNEEIWKEVRQPRLHDTLIRRMNGSLAYLTLTHVEGTHAAHPTRAALREIKKDPALDVFEESVAFKHEGVKNGEGWWAKGEESIWIGDKETKRIIALVIISKHPRFTMMRRLGRQQKQWDAAFGLDAIFSYERLPRTTRRVSLLGLVLLDLVLLDLDLLGGLLAILACRILKVDRSVSDLVRARLALATLSRRDHLGPIPPNSFAPVHPEPVRLARLPACPPSSSPSSPAPFAEPPALFEGVGLDETGLAVMCHGIWPGGTNAGCDEEERKRRREAISEKGRLWWASLSKEGQERQLQPMRQGHDAWLASGGGAERTARSAATNKKNRAKKRDDALAAACDLDKAVLAEAESVSSLRKALGKEYLALCRRLDAPTPPSDRDESRGWGCRDRDSIATTCPRPTASSPVPSSTVPDAERARLRPGMKRRFSRSLTSLVSLVPRRPDESADDAADDEATKLSKWHAKGKAKLIKAFKPPQNSSGSASRVATPGADDDVSFRVSSRSRSYSAPLFLPPHVLEDEVASRRVPPTSPPVAHPRIEDDSAKDESPYPSAFNTCPSSPILDSGFASSTPNPAISTTLDPSSLVFELVAEPEPEPDLFARLPREVQLRVFRALLEACEEEWRKEVKEGRWTGEKACERWGDGRVRGWRELVKMGRVCRLWRSLSLDGQLWSTAPAASLIGATSYSSASLLSLAVGAGGFVKTFDARGLGKSLDWATLAWMIVPLDGASDTGLTNLTSIDLTGCTSLTSASLTSLLSHSPHLLRLAVPNLRCVDNSHMATLGSSCPHLVHLDVSRCPNLRGPALQKLPHPPQPPQNTLSRPFTSEDLLGGLVTLKAAGLSGVNGSDLASFLSRHRRLVTLDLSWCRGITDNGLKTAVQQLSPSDSANLSSPSASKRVFPSLRHLNLSACHSISSLGLSHLAGTVPNLEILELSRLGSGLRTDGLARLVASCPKLRKLDIEDADQAGDDVLHALVGVGDATGAPNLEHLVISACTGLTDPAIAAVARGCLKLRVLEADTTAISDRTAKEFVQLARERASQAQKDAVSRKGDADPLLASKYPAVLSLLDNRQTGRRLSRDLGSANLRCRIGQRGHWTNVVGGYLDEDDASHAQESPAKKKLQAPLSECDESRVVVRSFYSNLAIDAALAIREASAAKKRQAKAGGGGGEPRQGALRTRAMSDSEVLRRTDTGDEDGRVACVIS